MSDAPAAGRRARLQTLGLLVAVFAAGGLAGAAIEHTRAAPAPGERRDVFRPPTELPRGGIPRFYEDLDLSDAQRVEIRAILERSRPETDSLLQIALPRLRELTESTRAAIRDVLTPAQREELDARFRGRRERSRGGERGGRRPPPGSPPGRD